MSCYSDETNKRSLVDIQRSIFVLCLDQPCLSDGRSGQLTDQSEISSRLMGQVNHGGGSAVNTGNRWFDKIFQVSRSFLHYNTQTHVQFYITMFSVFLRLYFYHFFYGICVKYATFWQFALKSLK